jgi:predicted GNAT superfamily acetyltransferase
MAAGQENLAGSAIEIRKLEDQAEFEATLPIQAEVWGYSEMDLVPSRLLGVARFIGGLVLGAYDGGRLIGFNLVFPGRKPDGAPYWHSHMTAILPAYQNTGVGRRIKLRQREEAILAGVRLVEWTFDPLEIRNAYFNIERLGVIARGYVPNLYGITSSALHASLPTDRLVAEWHVESARVNAIVERGGKISRKVDATITVPGDIAELKTRSADAARAIQLRIGEEFLRHFAAGRAVIGYRRTDAGGMFELGRLEEQPI